MKQSKRLITLICAILASVPLCFVGCNMGGNGDGSSGNVNFFMLNDTHGTLLNSGNRPGMAKVGDMLSDLTQENGEYIKIANGDMFQGSYIVSSLRGLPMVDVLNELEFDAFVIGNHEFDWGIEEIYKYADGDLTNGEADFPFLGANIYEKNTNKMIDWLEPYTIVEKNGVTVGIIGVMGMGLEADIMATKVSDYYFADYVPIVETYAKELRTEKDCDVVVVAAHDYSYQTNEKIAALSGDSLVDAMFCGHTHSYVRDEIQRGVGTLPMPALQNGGYNGSVTSLQFTLKDGVCANYSFDLYDITKNGSDQKVLNVIAEYQSYIDEGNSIIATAPYDLNKQSLGTLLCDGLIKRYNVDVAITNTGGVRSTISSGNITFADVFEVFPFENQAVLTKMTGNKIKAFYDRFGSAMYFNSNFDASSLQDSLEYDVAVVDYVFVHTSYVDYFGELEYSTAMLSRDVMTNYLKEVFPY